MNTDTETYHCPKCNKEFLDKELAIMKIQQVIKSERELLEK